MNVSRKRTYGSRVSARARSKPVKKSKVVLYKTPRWKALRNPHVTSVSNSMRGKLTYYDWFSLDPGAGTGVGYVFSANGCYDPNITGAGHQPAAFDQLMALYGEFIVLASTIKVRFRSTDSTIVTSVGIFIERYTSVTADFREYVENGNGVHTVSDTLATGDSIKTLTFSCDLSKETGINVLEDDTFAGTASANPSEQRYYHCVAFPFNGASNPAALECSAEITYDVVFRDKLLTSVS